ncbi:Chymotrypsin-like elastase family member 1 [Portunus trituberculatus]|uniref:Chymotrypsin-like elastase family member 1 n=1 Tax=Portunus trituberculatus TaxID=210409 RepID=A0A5B7HXS0_PORTR|nr:Chymotrypsin-like elastase family member 1 [Portunus trituberculatus]
MLPGRRDGNERSKTDGNTLSFKPRIVDGTEAEKHEFPWVVVVQVYNPKLKKYKRICGASVIDEWWIMTAAHCVDYDTSFKIIAGEHELSAVEGNMSVKGGRVVKLEGDTLETTVMIQREWCGVRRVMDENR